MDAVKNISPKINYSNESVINITRIIKSHF
jgi:hypothetical protein